MNPRPTELPVGRIVGVFGVRGELKLDPSRAARAVFTAGAQLRCERGGASSTILLDSVRAHKGRLLIRIAGVDNAQDGAAYTGGVLFAPRAAISLQEGEYLDDDLVGCALYDPGGIAYGSVERVEHYPASDMLVVGGRMIPMVRAIVREIDLERRRIVIDPPEGLLD